mgnify:CR=1 FL=1
MLRSIAGTWQNLMQDIYLITFPEHSDIKMTNSFID